MTTIRPNLPSTPQPQPRPMDPARLAAQKAFFAAALGQPQAATAAPSQASVEPRPAAAQLAEPRAQAAAAAPARAPDRILRPGSILDIRV